MSMIRKETEKDILSDIADKLDRIAYALEHLANNTREDGFKVAAEIWKPEE